MTGTSLFIERFPELCLRIGEHILLTGSATGLAIILGVPLGILASRVTWLRTPVMSAIGIFQTIPSLAMLALLLALLHRIGTLPAIVALTLYALLPIVRNTVAGLEGVDAGIIEAARGIGMRSGQQLRMVMLPLAMPVIVAGIRTAAVVGVGIATLSAFIGAGGLGQFINRGLALSNTNLILLGAIPAALLALLVDATIAATEWGLRPARHASSGKTALLVQRLAVCAPIILIILTGVVFALGARLNGTSGSTGISQDNRIRIGSKNFTEQLILAEIMAQLLEKHTDLVVERKFNLGGTMICHKALANAEIDLYPEYTGTALTAILHRETVANPEEAFAAVNREYQKEFGVEWLMPFGFNNTYAITVRASDAQEHGWSRISDLAAWAGELKAGFTSEFSERPDGYPGLQTAYGFAFSKQIDLDPSVMYDAIAKDEVDVICAFATDGRIQAYGLVPLEDDRNFFPPYYASPIVRQRIANNHPEVRDALGLLETRIDDSIMQRLNLQVDQLKQSPRIVAKAFLVEQGL